MFASGPHSSPSKPGKPHLVGIGELLWDLLPAGRQLGGAPANFACHARALGAASHLISRVGDDPLGRAALARLDQLGVDTSAVEIDPGRPTGTVSVALEADGQPRFTIHEDVAWDALSGGARALEVVRRADAVCFGSLGQRNPVARSAIQRLLAATPAEALRILDVNLRQHYFSKAILLDSLGFADVLKVNDNELPRLAEMLALEGDLQSQIQQLANRYSLRCVVYTRGSRGSLLLADGHWADHPGFPTTVVDTVGAGDSFTAALALGLLGRRDLNSINEHANRVAAFVCSQPGATPTLPTELHQDFAR